ncbi:MAG: hypothetical protein RLZZ336_1170, partial [Cyanobacteriota bacterium]
MARIRCCTASGCRAAGGPALMQALLQARADQGLASDALTIKPVGCLRLCGRGPLVAIDAADGGAQRLYGAVPPASAPVLVQLALAAHAPGVAASLAGHAVDGEHPFFALQQPVVLEGLGLVDPESLDDALAHGAYSQLQ